MKINFKNITYVFLIIFVIILFDNVVAYYQDREEYRFIISKIELTAKGSLRIYNKEHIVGFKEFSIYKTWDIKEGDLFYKPKFSDFIYTYRKDSISGKYNEKCKIHRL